MAENYRFESSNGLFFGAGGSVGVRVCRYKARFTGRFSNDVPADYGKLLVSNGFCSNTHFEPSPK